MLQVEDLLKITDMPAWSEISLNLYVAFSRKYLLPTIFRYHLSNGKVIDVIFTEWGIYHMLGIQHIDGKIANTEFFGAVDKGLEFNSFTVNKGMRKRFYDMKHRIRSFACVYQIMKNDCIFYVQDNKLQGSNIIAAYIKFGMTDGKGVNIGIRNQEGKYIPYTILIDRASHATATIDKLKHIDINKLEIYRGGKLIEEIKY